MSNLEPNAPAPTDKLPSSLPPAEVPHGESAQPSPSAPEGSPVLDPSVRRVELGAIVDRESNLRPLNPGHSLELAESIAAVGLLQFIVVDENLRLLAGGHRLNAIRLLREVAQMSESEVREIFERGKDPERLSKSEIATLKNAYEVHFKEGVVVRVLPTSGFAASEVRLQVEAIENEKRLDFSKDELAEIVSRLQAAGYRDTVGKPKVGQKVLSRELGRIMGKSRRTVFRLLHELRTGEKASERRKVSPAMEALAEEISEKLGTKVQFKAGAKQSGALVVHFQSHKQRKDLLKRMRLAK